MRCDVITWEMACKKLCKRLGLKLRVSKSKSQFWGELTIPNGYVDNWDERVCVVMRSLRNDVFMVMCWHLGEKTYLNDTYGKLACMKRLSEKYTSFGTPSSPEEMLLKLEVADGISL